MSEQWHDDHKKAVAEKWTQCPPVTTKVKELIGDEVCMGTYGLVELEVMQLETELAEARAEIDKLNAEAERLKEEVLDAAREWNLYVEVDSAPRTLVEHLENKFKEILK